MFTHSCILMHYKMQIQILIKSNNEPGDWTNNECGFQRFDFIKVCEKVHIKQFCASGITKAERK